MTGKTHTAAAAAAASVLLAFIQASSRYATVAADQGVRLPYDLAGCSVLILAGVTAGLFPDLDAAHSELHLLPDRAVRALLRYMRAAGRKRSIGFAAAQACLGLAARSVSALLAGISALLHTFTYHRGFTHTIWCALATAALAALASLPVSGGIEPSARVGLVWLAGYASHLTADACTPSGIPLFGTRRARTEGREGREGMEEPRRLARASRPLQRRARRFEAFHLLPRKMRVTTGSFVDTVIVRRACWCIFLASLPALLTRA